MCFATSGDYCDKPAVIVHNHVGWKWRINWKYYIDCECIGQDHPFWYFGWIDDIAEPSLHMQTKTDED